MENIEKEKHKCIHCGKKEFHLTSDFSKGICDNCGFEFDYEQLPFMKKLIGFVKDIQKAMKVPIDVKDLEEIKE